MSTNTFVNFSHGVNVSRNRALGDDGGGVMQWTNSEVHLSNGVLISDNSAKDRGGGLWGYKSRFVLSDGVHVVDNSASGFEHSRAFEAEQPSIDARLLTCLPSFMKNPWSVASHLHVDPNK